MIGKYTNDETPTNRTGKNSGNGSYSDLHHTVGQLMAESLNHRHRLETIEALVENAGLVPGSIPPKSKRARLFYVARTAFTTTAVIIAALLSALKELGFLGGH